MDAIPAPVRKVLYLILFVGGVAVGALNVADVNTGKAVDVIAYLGTALGLVAAGNMPGTRLTPHRDAGDEYGEDGAANVDTLVVLAVGFLGGLFLGYLLWRV